MPKTILTRLRAEGDGTIGDAMEPISEQCLSCTHINDVPLSCKAFPEGIPGEILDGDFDHTVPYDGDNGVQYEEK